MSRATGNRLMCRQHVKQAAALLSIGAMTLSVRHAAAIDLLSICLFALACRLFLATTPAPLFSQC